MCYVAVDLPIKYLDARIRGFQLKDLGTKSELGHNELKGKWVPKNMKGSFTGIAEESRKNGKD